MKKKFDLVLNFQKTQQYYSWKKQNNLNIVKACQKDDIFF